ncbi:putative NADH-ubiquinone oxidoreductase 9.5 kDa subunit [Lineolata rhizophorae]|uniref:Putative NADH-ubiquinone oxidoreductase 9.5 kDa subunit n=1 Tax=Lineolata rhizophorae TaxID=578093 RepID=A0A6A6NQY3_9PEZI|nr:putative NADH-ubiquinone oxidoreductase 9.5 kDa subunit [Lineolata rhizophorae]
MNRPPFWTQPIRFFRYTAHERPALFWSILVGCVGPVMIVTVPPLRHRFGDPTPERIPLTYPIPKGPRKIPEGFDDE